MSARIGRHAVLAFTGAPLDDYHVLLDTTLGGGHNMWCYGVRKKFIIHAALFEEENEGWVWMAPIMPSRSVVKIKDCDTKHKVFCQIRNFDGNFIKRYNENPSTVDIRDPCQTIVMSGWYRDALGGFDTTRKSNQERTLEIKSACIWGWRSLRAACHHPDLAVRLGTRLGVLGAYLGIVSLIFGLLAVVDPLVQDDFKREMCSTFGLILGNWILPIVVSAVTLLIIGIPACLACRSPRLPKPRPLAKQGA